MKSPEFSVYISNKKDPIRVSWYGNEECFTENRKIILDAFGNGVLQWKRDSQTSTFPLNLRFQPSFVPFDAECSIIKNGNSNDNISSEFAFLHIYFIFAKNFEEYRISVRPDISEWFSDLTEANCHSWLIIFDSSRVKDKKNRTQINDKLKNDFARFQNRIFESNEISSEKSKSSLTLILQNNLFSSFDNYSNNLINKLRKLKEVVNEDSFVLSNFINEQFRLCLFYWSLCLFEMALAELDSLTSFFADSIRALAQKNDSALNSINWLKQLRPLPLDKCCILLNQQLYASSFGDDWQLVRVHAHLLAHQIMLSASLLNYRLNLANTPSTQHSQEHHLPQTTNQVLAVKALSEVQSSSNTITTDSSALVSSPSLQSLSQHSSIIEGSTTTFSQLNTLQLRHDCITTVLNYVRETLQRLEEDLHILSANFNSAHLNFLFIFWQEEIVKFVEHLLFSVDYELENKTSVYDELVMMESTAASHAAFLLHKKSEALFNLYLLLTNTKKSQEVTLARRWLQQTSLPSSTEDDNIFIPESFRILNDFFCNSTDLEKFRIYVKDELNEALNIFRKHNWMGHVLYLEYCISTLSHNSNEDSYNREKEHVKRLLSGDSLFQVQDINGYLKKFLNDYNDHFEQLDSELLFDCVLVLLIMSKNPLTDEFEGVLSKLSTQYRTKSNLSWLKYNLIDISSNRPLIQFPFKIVRICSPPLFRSTLHQPAQLILDIYNSFSLQFYNCKIKATFKLLKNHSNEIPLTRKVAFQQKLQIEDSANENIYSLECVVIDCLKEEKFENNEKEEIVIENVVIVDGDVDLIVPGVNKCIFKINENKQVGCFQLCSIQIHTINPKCNFMLDFGREMERNSLLEHVFLLVDKVEPSISVKEPTVSEGYKVSGDFLELTAGMKQKISLEFYSGTNSYLNDTFCSFTLVGIENKHLQFLDSDGKWISNKVQHQIPPIKPNGSYSTCIELCMAIEKVLPITSTTTNNSPQNEDVQLIKCELKLEWKNVSSETIVTKFLQLKFSPLFGLYCTTSLLAGNAIFILDVERRFVKPPLHQITILPIAITLHQEQNIALEPVETKLLNPNPLIPIISNSSFRFIWRLPESPAGRNFPVPHFLKFIYKVYYEQKENKNIENNEKNNQVLLKSSEYSIEKRLDFPIPKVDFEICARFYSEHSQSLLCRVDQPCDFVVSLRSLAKLIEAETVIVSIENENNNNGHWYCQQKHKIVKVKDSGVGQAIFSIVPKLLGHLPYPSISLYKYIPSENSSKQLSINEKRFGERLITFYRNKGNQIHILSPLSGSEESTSLASTNTSESEQKKKSLKSQAKDRLSRLFE